MKYGVRAKEFKLLTPEEQMKWIEKQTEKVLSRLPTLKNELKVFDDRSSELYNLSPEEIKLTSRVYSSQIDAGAGVEGIEDYIQQLETYGNVDISALSELSTNKRIASFLDNIKSVASEEEYDYVKTLLDKLTDEEKKRFVKSKYFFDTGNLNSEDFVKFINEFDVSVGTAKLESFMASIGKDMSSTKFFIKGETRVKLGRPKKRKRKRK